MNKFITYPSICLCFFVSAISSNTMVISLFVLIGISIAIIGKVNPYTLLVIALPFTVTISQPFTFTASVSDFVLPWTLTYALNRIWPQIKKLIVSFRAAFFWVFALLATIGISLLGNEIQPISFGFSLAKLIFAMIFGLISILFVFEHRDQLNKIWKIAEVWVRTSTAISALGIASYIFLLAGFPNQLMYESARLQSVFDNPNSFAAYGVVSLGITAAYSLEKSKPLLNAFSLIIIIALVLSNSRAASIAVVIYVSVGFFLFLKSKINLKKWTVYGITLLLISFLMMPTVTALIDFTSAQIVSTSVSETGQSAEAGQDGKLGQNVELSNPVTSRESISEDSRMTIWKTSLILWSEKPFQGVGFGQFINLSKSTLGVPYVVHNSFLSFLTETGLLGFVVFTVGFLVVGVNLLKTKKTYSKILFATLLSLCVMMLSNNLENTRYLWLFIGACYSLPMLQKRSED